MPPRPDIPPIEPVHTVTVTPIRPAAGWYWVGGLVLVAGLMTSFLLLIVGAFGYIGEINDLARVAMPGEAVVDLADGTTAVYHERGAGPLLTLDGLGLRAAEPDGGEAEVRVSTRGDTYRVEGRAGVPVAEIVVEAPGAYTISVAASGPGAVAIGPRPGERLSTWGQAAIVVAVAGVGVGTAILVVTRWRRRGALARRSAQPRSASPAPVG